MQQSDSIKELSTALNKAQAEIGGAVKDANNPFYKSKYADLTAVIEAAKGPLAKHGLSVTQMTDFDNGVEYVETQIMHSSGEWIRGRMLIKTKDNTPQSMGSGISYSRRYALQAALNIPAVDDDGQEAQGSNVNKQTKAPQGSLDALTPIRTEIAKAVKDKKIPAAYMKEFITTNFGEDALLSNLDEKALQRTLEHVGNFK